MTAVLAVLSTVARLVTPHTGKRGRHNRAPLAVSPMASPDNDTQPMERAS